MFKNRCLWEYQLLDQKAHDKDQYRKHFEVPVRVLLLSVVNMVLAVPLVPAVPAVLVLPVVPDVAAVPAERVVPMVHIVPVAPREMALSAAPGLRGPAW